MNCEQRRGAHRTLLIAIVLGLGAGAYALGAAGHGSSDRPGDSPDHARAQVLRQAQAPTVVAAFPAGVTVSSAYVPHVAKSAPEEPVLPTPGPTPGEVVAQSEPVAVQTVSANAVEPRTWVLSPTERVTLYAIAGVPTKYIPILEGIGYCESKHSPGAVGDGGNSLGWFQIWTGWFREGEDPFDPETNLRVALRIRETRGRWGGGGGWTCADILNIY